MDSVQKSSAIISVLQTMLAPSHKNAMVVAEGLKQVSGPNSEMSRFFQQISREIDNLVMQPPPPKGRRGKKAKKMPCPEAIPEENEEGDGGVTSFIPTSSIASSEDSTPTSEVQESQDTTTSTNRPRRAAVNAAEEKIKRMTEVSANRKLRRPSDFNQNDHGNYNVYNVNQTHTVNQTQILGNTTQTIEIKTQASGNTTVVVGNTTQVGKVDKSECFPRTKRRKGSGANCSVVTSSHFFSSTMIHSSSPIQKAIPGLDPSEGSDVSMIPPHSDSIMEVEDTGHRTRTRTLRQRKAEDTLVVVKEEAVEMDVEVEEKENLAENKQDMASPDEELPSRTRTRNIKKPVNKVASLPEVQASSGNASGGKMRDYENLSENGGEKSSVSDAGDVSNEGRVTRTKARKMNKSAEDEKNKAEPEFKVPLAIKNTKDTKKPPAATKKAAEKAKEIDEKKAALDERKRLREERAQKAAQARDQAEKEKRENALKLEKEREEKLKLKRQRDEKMKEEAEKKRLAMQAKIEQQKRECDAARTARLQEIMEEEARKEAKWKREQELAERKAQAVQQAKLAEKLKAAKLGAKKDVPAAVEEPNYSISEDPVPSDEDETETPKKPIPSWALPMNRNIVLAHQIYLSSQVAPFFENPADFSPSAREMFGDDARMRPRTSSAVWNETMRE